MRLLSLFFLLVGTVAGQVPNSRAISLASSQESVVKSLSSFAGQVAAYPQMCGHSSMVDKHTLYRTDPDERDEEETADALIDIYSKSGWRTFTGGRRWMVQMPVYWEKCSRDGKWAGVFVFVNSNASAKTLEAAKVLSDSLSKVLPSQNVPVFNKIDSTVATDKQNAIVLEHPEVIVVVIGTKAK